MKNLVLILHNIRSTYNVGAILRTADGLGVKKVYFSGYTPHLLKGLPHERDKLKKQIHKTALGAEDVVPQEFAEDIKDLILSLKTSGYSILALEQNENSINLAESTPKEDYQALILGEEVHGITDDIIALADHILEIPMFGQKESFNVSVAAAIAIWELSKN